MCVCVVTAPSRERAEPRTHSRCNDTRRTHNVRHCAARQSEYSRLDVAREDVARIRRVGTCAARTINSDLHLRVTPVIAAEYTGPRDHRRG